MADDPEPLAEDASATTPKSRKPVAAPDTAWPRWAYAGPPRTYTHIPVTVDDGDVIEWPDLPSGDGAWTSTVLPVSRRPDNHRTEG